MYNSFAHGEGVKTVSRNTVYWLYNHSVGLLHEKILMAFSSAGKGTPGASAEAEKKPVRAKRNVVQAFRQLKVRAGKSSGEQQWIAQLLGKSL